ncbi:MAG: SPW repeat protein [Acetobacteraceae bacterium]|nr:SPW repeat protein [Acetobacteraceae bacterium]
MMDWRKALFGGQILIGLALALTPWLFGFAAETVPAWTAWATGAVMALSGVAALASFAFAASWVALVAGVWSILAPWLLTFSGETAATWSHVAAGALMAISAAAALWYEYQPRKTAQA